ncbi:MAG: OmpH family outer membrane protein [Xanthomonadales bacterium]|nr:OmpH family outer membrane protein [Xanthomonadales bacterium]
MQATQRSTPAAWARWLLLSASLALCAWIPGATAQNAQAAPRIAYVDMQRLIDNAPQMSEARERLAREFAARDELLKADEKRLSALRAELEEATPVNVPSGTRDRQQQEAEALGRLIERTRAQLADELNARSREEVDRTWPIINEAVAEYARAQGIDLVVGSPVLFVSGRLDITEQVLAYLRERQREDGGP